MRLRNPAPDRTSRQAKGDATGRGAEERPLAGRVALVAGATRGVGRGVAAELGQAGATVYVTGRSAARRRTLELGATVEEVAAEVSALGGTGIPVACDHTDDRAVGRLLERVRRQHARLDILVNSVWGGYEVLHAGRVAEWRAPFWRQPTGLWDSMLDAGVRAHYVTTALAAPLMIGCGQGLVVTISFFPVADAPVGFRVAKVADDRLAADMAEQLRPHGIASVSLYPGVVRTEAIMRVADRLDLRGSESPRFTGRAVVALATDPDVLARSGEVLIAAELAELYGFDDIDGSRPASLRGGRRLRAVPTVTAG
jgi:NAD(P)-dependent dehydrogenase (short-subunit alcohol dehydrogenase family)